nr:DUF2847 family protein [Chitinophagaceae bacterium]
MMSFPWQQLNDVSQIDQIKAASYTAPQVIFKHSIRCNISSVALRRFESSDPIAGVVYHFIDLINYRTVSNTVADVFKVYH